MAEEGIKSSDTPSFYRSVSNDASMMSNRCTIINPQQVDYDSPQRYLFEFFKHSFYKKFYRQYFSNMRKLKSLALLEKPSSQSKIKLGKLPLEKTLFLEIDQIVVLMSEEKIHKLPLVSWVFNLNRYDMLEKKKLQT